jgi:hypothetical protein
VAGDAMWNPQIDQTGAEVTAPPPAPCAFAPDVSTHALTYTHGTDSMGRPVQLSSDSVF